MLRSLAAGTLAVVLFCAVTACGGDGSENGEAATKQAAVSPAVKQAVADYREYVIGQVDELEPLVKSFTDAVRAGDLKSAQDAYAPSREPWERIEPIAGLVEEIDGKVDARVDDFENESDPAFTGWHRIEYLLFEKKTTDGATEFADQLDADIATLKEQIETVDVTPTAVAIGAAELIEEVSGGKITGEEDRYSKTDLWDFNANVEGAEQVIDDLRPALQEEDPELLASIDEGFKELRSNLDPLRDGDGWKPYCLEDDQYPSDICSGVTVDPPTVDRLKANLAALSEDLALVAGALGLK